MAAVKIAATVHSSLFTQCMIPATPLRSQVFPPLRSNNKMGLLLREQVLFVGSTGVGGSFLQLNIHIKLYRERNNRTFCNYFTRIELRSDYSRKSRSQYLLPDLKNQPMGSSCVKHILPFCGYFKGQEQICFNPTSWHLVTYNFLRGHTF